MVDHCLPGNQLPFLKVDEAKKPIPFLLEKRQRYYICQEDTDLTFTSLLKIVLIYQSYWAFLKHVTYRVNLQLAAWQCFTVKTHVCLKDVWVVYDMFSMEMRTGYICLC